MMFFYCRGKKEEGRILWMEIFFLVRYGSLIEMVIGWVIFDLFFLNGKFSYVMKFLVFVFKFGICFKW